MKKFIIFLSLFLFFGSSCIFAQQKEPSISPTEAPKVEYSLPYPGILPDHPLYFLKNIRDKILIFINRDPVKKSELLLLLSDKNLVMGQMLWDREIYETAQKAFNQSESYLLFSIDVLETTEIQDNLPPGMVERYGQAAKKHEEILTNLINITEDSQKLESLQNSLNLTKKAKERILSLK